MYVTYHYSNNTIIDCNITKHYNLLNRNNKQITMIKYNNMHTLHLLTHHS